MKPITKAVIYSLLIFPGSGFFLLNQKRIGYGFVLSTFVFLVVVMTDAMYKANVIADELIRSMSKDGILDPQLLTQTLQGLPVFLPQKLLETPGLLPELLVSLSTYAIVVIWVLGVAGLWVVKKPS